MPEHNGAVDPAAAKKLGGSRALPLRADWEKVKDDIMLTACIAKFEQHSDCRETLLGTGDATLVEVT